jgi:hypothetical protein
MLDANCDQFPETQIPELDDDPGTTFESLLAGREPTEPAEPSDDDNDDE